MKNILKNIDERVRILHIFAGEKIVDMKKLKLIIKYLLDNYLNMEKKDSKEETMIVERRTILQISC